MTEPDDREPTDQGLEPEEPFGDEELDEGLPEDLDETELEAGEDEEWEEEPEEAEEAAPAAAPGRRPSAAPGRGGPGRRRDRGDRGAVAPAGTAARAAAPRADQGVRIDDRISKVYAVLAAGSLLAVLAYGLLLGYGGLLTPVPTPVPTPAITASPTAAASPTISASASPSAAPSASPSPSAS